MNSEINAESFNDDTLVIFSQLDDYDIVAAMKDWQNHDDFVLSNLCQMILERRLLKIKIKNKAFKQSELKSHFDALMKRYNISKSEAEYFVFQGELSNQAYENKAQKINVLFKSGKIKDIVKASHQLNLKALSKPITKYYMCYPKKKM
ncbi:Deoxyguanosinetriphosphate triphosphohydrolase [Winogradskyella psychrotolerans RS-3]|uniref:Deoxyguanosinetriphosphate triphosphohydrolase n=1 Tax=Winogradskyella psychrotolerans RS-3 TaxID=641526 RepID=S7X2A8_9FLAO|nr:Deoxyguanosinetriphosphate triphosphohydrolase [Winogradskyella psychrotolerans RS-3]